MDYLTLKKVNQNINRYINTRHMKLRLAVTSLECFIDIIHSLKRPSKIYKLQIQLAYTLTRDQVISVWHYNYAYIKNDR